MGCKAPTVVIGGVTLSTNDAENAQALLDELGGDNGDPTFDEYTTNIAGGNNSTGTKGVQVNNPPTQTSAPTPPPANTPKTAENNTPPPVMTGKPVDCGSAWTGNYDDQLSPNFKVRNFTVNCHYPNPMMDYGGYTATQRVCFLQHLAINVAEPLLAKFGKFRINSAIRNKETCDKPLISQHTHGQACDLQWPGWSLDKYWESAQWVKDNIPYDQYIYEYSAASGSVWYHLSYVPTGARKAGDRTKVMTMWQNHYIPGLQRYK